MDYKSLIPRVTNTASKHRLNISFKAVQRVPKPVKVKFYAKQRRGVWEG
jgi:hypothetical protein